MSRKHHMHLSTLHYISFFFALSILPASALQWTELQSDLSEVKGAANCEVLLFVGDQTARVPRTVWKCVILIEVLKYQVWSVHFDVTQCIASVPERKIFMINIVNNSKIELITLYLSNNPNSHLKYGNLR